jgi:hypothetical protein
VGGCADPWYSAAIARIGSDPTDIGGNASGEGFDYETMLALDAALMINGGYGPGYTYNQPQVDAGIPAVLEANRMEHSVDAVGLNVVSEVGVSVQAPERACSVAVRAGRPDLHYVLRRVLRTGVSITCAPGAYAGRVEGSAIISRAGALHRAVAEAEAANSARLKTGRSVHAGEAARGDGRRVGRCRIGSARRRPRRGRGRHGRGESRAATGILDVGGRTHGVGGARIRRGGGGG